MCSRQRASSWPIAVSLWNLRSQTSVCNRPSSLRDLVSCRVTSGVLGGAAPDRVSAGVYREFPFRVYGARGRARSVGGTDEWIERVRYPHWRPIRGYSSVG
jgi:hypothetical protein